ncbi:hypothetical protein THAOC_25753 [Thalassiosira oceanica]|uniref:Uncharacterized protein n=1 Tax=Thalassiosira oceanica TaxID=159749 RepID=K0S0K3_THAOC|nr:hypothetical protein THAOC_25753 [Thalassiosira oceanica]|eukprot:EJK54601.1 hypothetical protein THAOC_25753 [Thalassiosira oceanica]
MDDTQVMNGHAMNGHAADGHTTDGWTTRNGWTRNGWTRNGWTHATDGHATDGHAATVQTQTVHAVLARAAASNTRRRGGTKSNQEFFISTLCRTFFSAVPVDTMPHVHCHRLAALSGRALSPSCPHPPCHRHCPSHAEIRTLKK